jgi:hypothetical protein
MRLDMAKRHLNILGWLYMAMGALGFLGALVVFLVMVGGGFLAQDPDARVMAAGMGTAIAGLVMLLSAPALIAGYGLLKQRRWSRVLTLVLAALNLFNFPLGTALGIYSFWVLMKEETGRLLASGGRHLPPDLKGPFDPRAPV